MKEFALGDFFTRVTRPGEPFDLAVSGHFYTPDPVQNLTFFVGASSISRLRDRALERRLAAAAKLSGRARDRAVARLALELQHDLVPAAAISTTAARDSCSARIGCQVYQPVWGMDLAALCLRK